MKIEERLEDIRVQMMQLKNESADRMHEPLGHVQYLRIFHHLEQIEGALISLSWAVKRLANPHSD